MLEVWQKYVLRHLEVAVEGARRLVEQDRERNISPEGLGGTLEWTLPWGMDDGDGDVRLTVVDVSTAWGEPKRVRVVVYAEARSFFDRRERSLPRYDPESPARPWSHAASRLTTDMAEYLLRHAGGDPESLRKERGGALSFVLVVHDSWWKRPGPGT